VVNETDLKGRKAENITRVRAVFADQDTQGAPIPDIGLDPHMVIESSPGKHHAYWLVDDLQRDQFRTQQQAIAARCGSDTAVCDLPRVMRLPGFLHQKNPDAPSLVRIIEHSPLQPYTAERIRAACPPLQQAVNTPTPTSTGAKDEHAKRARKIAWDGARRTHNDPSRGRHDELTAMGHYLRRDGVPMTKELFSLVLGEYEKLMRPTNAAGEVVGMDKKTESKALMWGWSGGTDEDALHSGSAPLREPPADGKLNQGEVERLLAWALKTKTALPNADACGIFKGEPIPGKPGKFYDDHRVPFDDESGYSAPWLKILWEHGEKDFSREVDRYTALRMAMVVREAARTGEPPTDISPDGLKVHAAECLASIKALDVDDKEGRALLARVSVATGIAPFRLAHVAELLEQPEPLQWLVHGYLTPETMGLVFGDPAAGKSLLVIDWSACIATGRPWNGKPTKQGSVVYVAGEGHFGIKRRLKAWAIQHQAEAELCKAPFFVSEAGAAFTDPASVAVVTDAVDAIATDHGPPVLIVIDTLHRNLGPGDENSAADMAAFIQAADNLRVRYKSSVLVVHHSGHGDKARSRGSSSIRGAVDAEFMLETRGDDRALTCTKMKDGPTPEPLSLELVQVELPWIAEDGTPETSVVLNPTNRPVEAKRRNLPGNIRLAFDALLAAVGEHGASPGEHWRGGEPKPEKIVTLTHWRNAFFDKHTGDTADTKRRMFNKGRADLVASGAAQAWEDTYWATPEKGPWPQLVETANASALVFSMTGKQKRDEAA
jgi:hypothetical protein